MLPDPIWPHPWPNFLMDRPHPPKQTTMSSTTPSLSEDSPRVHHGPLRPPTKQEWNDLRPTIGKIYTHKTADAVRRELQRIGFKTSEKMIRDRLRPWGMANKYKKRKQRIPPGSDVSEATAELTEIGSLVGAEEPEPIARPLRTPDGERPWLHITKAADDWYTSLSEVSMLHQSWGRCKFHAAIAQLQQGLFAKSLDQDEAYSWRLLKEAGVKAYQLVGQGHPATLPSILTFLLDLPSGRDNPVALAVRCLLISSSQATLTSTHPVTLLCSIANLDEVPAQLCQRLLRVFQHHFPSGTGPSESEALATRIRLLCCDVHIKQGRFKEAETLLDTLDSAHGCTFAYMKAFRLRAYCQRAQGRHQAAVQIFQGALQALEADDGEVSGLGCKILADLAVAYRETGEYSRSEETQRKLLLYHELSGGDDITRTIIIKQLDASLVQQGKPAESEALRQQNPEAFDASNYYDQKTLADDVRRSEQSSFETTPATSATLSLSSLGRPS